MSRKFWIYITLTVPLTVMTVGYWLFYTRREKHIKSGKTANSEGGLMKKYQKRWLNMLPGNGLIRRGARQQVQDSERL